MLNKKGKKGLMKATQHFKPTKMYC